MVPQERPLVGRGHSSKRLSQAPLLLCNSLLISVVMHYFELAQASSMRMCPELEEKFPDFHGRQLELMMYLCLVAYNSEIYDGLCDDAWLRTTITLKDDHVDEPADYAHVFSNPDSREIRLMAKLCKGTPMCQSSWEQLEKNQSTLTSRIEIRWNILPRRAYWERLQKVQRQSNWTRVQSSLLWRTPCCSSRRGFIPITVIDQARQKGSSLKEKVDEWRNNGGRCDLAAHLQSLVVRPTVRRASLRTIEPNDVVSMERLGKGSAATVYKVSWRKGTYAMKSFKSYVFEMTFKERDIAERVFHPHIIHGFGYFEVDGRWSLLMEMLDTNLTRYAVEKRRVDVEPLFSREDTLDVLLQIASAVKHLHGEGVVHGDLKPDNIVLGSFEILGNGRHILAKVTDFGDAQFIEKPFSPAGDGTTKFAAPELLKWRKNRENVRFDYPEKIDVYSFGGVAHEVLTGYPAYFERAVDQFNADFGRRVIAGTLKPSGSEVWRNSGLEKRFLVELIKLVEQCWELCPEDRPSFSRICEVLERCKSLEDRAAKKRAELLKFFAMVSLFAFIWTSSLTPEKSAVDPVKFIALTLFSFIVMSYLCRVIRCVVCEFRDVAFAVKVKDS